MALTDPFVLPVGTVLVPVRELPESLRRDIQADETDFAISRPNSRAHSKIIDAEAAALLREFETPRTIAQAVARYSRDRKDNPERLLEEAFPLLQSLIAAQLLVAADSREAEQIQASLAPDEEVDGWAVLQCVQTLEDTELFQVRGPDAQFAALKIARSGSTPMVKSLLHREARVLARLDGKVTPRLLRAGEWNERPYLLIEWCAGVDVNSLSNDLRRQEPESRDELLRLAVAIVDVYATLHEQGVTHGDVHPRNVFVDRRQAVKLIDFGLGQFADDTEQERGYRGGVGFFLEPEFALASLHDNYRLPVSMAGEQYAVAVMLYSLFTGSHYLDFSLERQTMLRQIAEDPPLPFLRRGVQPWPEAEKVLEKALSKAPAARFGSMREFCDALRAIEPAPAVTRPTKQRDARLEEMKEALLHKLELSGPLLKGAPLLAPSVSVNYGAAGIAYALYRIASATEDGELLALADAWCAKSMREIDNDTAFYNFEINITPEIVGRTSLFHSAAGVYAVQALIAQARGDFLTQQLALGRFVEIASRPTDKLDVTLGRAGILLACSFLLNPRSSLSHSDRVEQPDHLRSLGQDTAAQLWHIMESYAPIRESKELSNLGAAHGWAGLLYAILCWSAVSHDPLPSRFEERLLQLGECAEPAGRGLRWPWDLQVAINQGRNYMPGWCNGSSGYVFLWTQAHRMLGRTKYFELAEGAAWNAWEVPSDLGNLCCGMAGQAYALLRMHRHTGESAWLSRAVATARQAVTMADKARSQPAYEQLALRPASLYKGDLGIVLLAADLESPQHACMPLFEVEE